MPRNVVKNMLTRGLDIDDNLSIKYLTLGTVTSGTLSHEHVKVMDYYKLDLIIIDRACALEKVCGEEAFLELIRNMIIYAKRYGSTLIISSVRNVNSQHLGVIDTLANTIIGLWYEREGDQMARKITVLKMRGSHHSTEVKELILDGREVRVK